MPQSQTEAVPKTNELQQTMIQKIKDYIIVIGGTIGIFSSVLGGIFLLPKYYHLILTTISYNKFLLLITGILLIGSILLCTSLYLYIRLKYLLNKIPRIKDLKKLEKRDLIEWFKLIKK